MPERFDDSPLTISPRSDPVRNFLFRGREPPPGPQRAIFAMGTTSKDPSFGRSGGWNDHVASLQNQRQTAGIWL